MNRIFLSKILLMSLTLLFIAGVMLVTRSALLARPTAITVNTTTDELNTNGNCSLREAIINAHGVGDCPVTDRIHHHRFRPGRSPPRPDDKRPENQTRGLEDYSLKGRAKASVLSGGVRLFGPPAGLPPAQGKPSVRAACAGLLTRCSGPVLSLSRFRFSCASRSINRVTDRGMIRFWRPDAKLFLDPANKVAPVRQKRYRMGKQANRGKCFSQEDL